MPSDMALHPDNIQGYDNLIQIARSDAVIVHNPGKNKSEPINPGSKGERAFLGETASPAGTFHREGAQAAEPLPRSNGDVRSVAPAAEQKSNERSTAHKK